MLGTHYFDQCTPESGDRDIDQVSHREMCGLEINANHSSYFQIDKQEEDVREGGATLCDHPDESRNSRPDSRPANSKQRQEMKRIDQESTNGVGSRFHGPMQIARRSSKPSHRFQHGPFSAPLDEVLIVLPLRSLELSVQTPTHARKRRKGKPAQGHKGSSPHHPPSDLKMPQSLPTRLLMLGE